MKIFSLPTSCCALALAVVLSACEAEAPATDESSAAAQAEAAMHEAASNAPSNRIDVPQIVRTNLGITFAEVQSTQLPLAIRSPGSFEMSGDARHHYTAPWAGHVRLADGLSEYGRVEIGQPVYTLEAPIFDEVRADIAAALKDIETALLERPLLKAEVEHARAARNPALFEGRRQAIDALEGPAEAHIDQLRSYLNVWNERLLELQELKANGAALAEDIAVARANIASLETELASSREEHAKLAIDRAAIDAEEVAAQRELPLAQAKLAALDNQLIIAQKDVEKTFIRAAATLRTSVEALKAEDDRGIPAWQRPQTLSVHARRAGVVAELPINDGAWVEQGEHILEVYDPSALRFRAHVRQTELAEITQHLNLVDGAWNDQRLQAWLRQPNQPYNPESRIPCTLRVVPSGDPSLRTFDLLAYPETLPAWAQVGVRSELELEFADESAASVMVIPRDAVIRDGLTDVVFRRDPWDENKVIRIEPLFGRRFGDLIEIKTEVAIGDQVVLGGVYELKLASGSSEQPSGGHFHADGTWHEGEH